MRPTSFINIQHIILNPTRWFFSSGNLPILYITNSRIHFLPFYCSSSALTPNIYTLTLSIYIVTHLPSFHSFPSPPHLSLATPRHTTLHPPPGGPSSTHPRLHTSAPQSSFKTRAIPVMGPLQCCFWWVDLMCGCGFFPPGRSGWLAVCLKGCASQKLFFCV